MVASLATTFARLGARTRMTSEESAPDSRVLQSVVSARLHAVAPFLAPRAKNRFAAAGIALRDEASLVDALDEADAATRADAAEMLGLQRARSAVSALRAKLQDAEPDVRTAAVVALMRIGDSELFPEIVKALRNEDARVVIGAAVALGHLGDRRVVPNLVAAFKTDDVGVGGAVAWSLGRIGDAAAVPWLATAIDQGFAVASACEALGRIGDERALEQVLAATIAPIEAVRAQAALALGRLRVATVETALRIVSTLRARLADEAQVVRLCAALSLVSKGEHVDVASLDDAPHA